MENNRNIHLVRPTLELKEKALQYRQEYFDTGENIINGSELFDKADTEVMGDRTSMKTTQNLILIFSSLSPLFQCSSTTSAAFFPGSRDAALDWAAGIYKKVRVNKVRSVK